MRLRTMLTLTTGAAAGAGAMYLLDPDQGPQRRSHARRHAVQQARTRGAQLATDAGRRAVELAGAAAAGYQQARAEAATPDATDATPPARGLRSVG